MNSQKGKTMTRLIDADALFDSMNSLDYESTIKAYEAIANAPTIDAVPHWITCEERLPEEYNPYLVCEEDGECIVHWLEDADWARRMIKNDGIVAWMPLPDPYVGERKDDE